MRLSVRWRRPSCQRKAPIRELPADRPRGRRADRRPLRADRARLRRRLPRLGDDQLRARRMDDARRVPRGDGPVGAGPEPRGEPRRRLPRHGRLRAGVQPRRPQAADRTAGRRHDHGDAGPGRPHARRRRARVPGRPWPHPAADSARAAGGARRARADRQAGGGHDRRAGRGAGRVVLPAQPRRPGAPGDRRRSADRAVDGHRRAPALRPRVGRGRCPLGRGGHAVDLRGGRRLRGRAARPQDLPDRHHRRPRQHPRHDRRRRCSSACWRA